MQKNVCLNNQFIFSHQLLTDIVTDFCYVVFYDLLTIIKRNLIPSPREQGQFSLVHGQPIHKNVLVRLVMWTSRAWHFHTPGIDGLSYFIFYPESSMMKDCFICSSNYSTKISSERMNKL